MGDTGSLALGGAFCSVAIMLKMPLILVVVAGDYKIDNAKYKHTFNVKAKMLKFEEVV